VNVAKILLIEDDLPLSLFLKEALISKLHHVDHVADGDDGLHWLRSQPYAAAIVDWDLPGMSGIDLCKSFRAAGGSTPILMLTGKEKLKDKITGLDAGADDYLIKPFELDELHARVRALLRRKDKQFESMQLTVGDISLDSESGTVVVASKRVQLTRREFGILEVLMQQPDETIAADTIIERVWPTDSDASPDLLRCHLTRLRTKLKQVSESAAQSIKAVYGLGYRLERP
jgi:DNA-binding response OmpR family regulator